MKSARVTPPFCVRPSAPPVPAIQQPGGALTPLQSHFAGALAGLQKMVQK